MDGALGDFASSRGKTWQIPTDMGTSSGFFLSTALIQQKRTSLDHAKSRSEHTSVHATKLDSLAFPICLLAHGDNALTTSESVVPTAAEPSERGLCLGNTLHGLKYLHQFGGLAHVEAIHCSTF